MNEWEGIERRRGYIDMEKRLTQAEDEIKKLTEQLISLNTELPHLQTAIAEVINQIKTHEERAEERQENYIKCRIQREKASDNIKVLWIVITGILMSNLFMIFKLLMSK